MASATEPATYAAESARSVNFILRVCQTLFPSPGTNATDLKSREKRVCLMMQNSVNRTENLNAKERLGQKVPESCVDSTVRSVVCMPESQQQSWDPRN